MDVSRSTQKWCKIKAISMKFFTPRVNPESSPTFCQKLFSHLSQKWCEIEQFQQNILPLGCTQSCLPGCFQNLFFASFGDHLEFLHKMCKKTTFISETVQNRGISTKFSTYRLYTQSSATFYQKLFGGNTKICLSGNLC